MKNWKYSLIKFAAIVFIIAALIYPFPNDSQKRTAHTDAALASTPRQATIFDDSRPEMRIKHLLGLDYPPRLDIASLLKQEPERRRGTTYQEFPTYPAVASASRREKGDRNQ